MVLPVEEGRHALIGTGELAHDVWPPEIAEVERLGTRDGVHLELDRVVVRKVRAAQLSAPESPQPLEPGRVLQLELARPLERVLGEARLRPGILALIEAEYRHQLRILGEALVHEDIEQRIEALRSVIRGGCGERCLTE